ncbi:nuclease-related domain-containing protein [Pseudanabaena sp. FACHB-2040]|uniref:nuclease-related domain-containing protein n=1 Tax=Pseudanabaena sp. FACHB-2040 TaxID=2692859 RepID=UPI001681C406|nr:nuclease-related domain-containing protein [Pseudanabaena sp. FACHB-2040]MBD2256999.1 NERD domain-containing protein [Pseudanabaena sp. FACHB-2040]
MAKSSSQAGKSIRHLAAKRKAKAILSFISAGLVAIAPSLLVNAFNNFLGEISSLSDQAQDPVLQVSIYFYLLFFLITLGFIFNGFHLLKRARHADQGAKGEEDTAQALRPLEREGWQIEYNLRLKGGLGDADIVCTSPKKQTYAIDVKSHRGEVFTNGTQLQRRMGHSTYPFEKDFLNGAMRQALQVKEQKSLRFVTPIVAFSAAKVSVPPEKLRGVYVVETAKLVVLLKALG